MALPKARGLGARDGEEGLAASLVASEVLLEGTSVLSSEAFVAPPPAFGPVPPLPVAREDEEDELARPEAAAEAAGVAAPPEDDEALLPASLGAKSF